MVSPYLEDTTCDSRVVAHGACRCLRPLGDGVTEEQRSQPLDSSSAVVFLNSVHVRLISVTDLAHECLRFPICRI